MKPMISAVCVFFPLALFGADQAASQSKFATEFAKHWTNAKELTLAVAEAMPAENYDFKPVPEEMSFGEQINHIGAANYNYCSRLNKSKSPYTKPEKFDKATVTKIVADSFDYCSGMINSLTDDQLNDMRGPMSVREVLLGVQTHMAHHRGQIEVYLRLKDIKPPSYKF